MYRTGLGKILVLHVAFQHYVHNEILDDVGASN